MITSTPVISRLLVELVPQREGETQCAIVEDEREVRDGKEWTSISRRVYQL